MVALRFRLLACVLAAMAALAGVSASRANDGERREVRIEGRCSASSDFRLRVRREDGRLRIEFRVEADRASGIWSVVIVHERRLVFHRTVRPVRGGTELDLRRTIRDWPGTNTIVVRASTPTGESCRATATL
jgi:hypothetical protein